MKLSFGFSAAACGYGVGLLIFGQAVAGAILVSGALITLAICETRS